MEDAGGRKAGLTDRAVPGIEGTARVLVRPLGAGRVVVVGQSLDDRDEALAGLLATFAVGGPIAVLLASLLGYALASTALRPVEVMRRRAEHVSLEAGEPALPLPVAHDEIRRLGETLNAMLDRLQRSFERERRFVADAGHELRTPIAVAKIELETLLRQDPTEAVVAASAAIDHLARLADDLLILARSADGRLPVAPERLDAHRVLDDTRTRFAARAAAEGREITLDVADGATLVADPLRIRQALDNLLDNALRHGGGRITLAAQDGAIEVADEGAGFGDFADHAFERFARADEARTHGGAGLGLAIVRAIAEAHGGGAEIAGAARVRMWFVASAPSQPAAAPFTT